MPEGATAEATSEILDCALLRPGYGLVDRDNLVGVILRNAAPLSNVG